MGALHRNLGHIRQAMQYFEKELQIVLKQQVGDKSLGFLAHTNLELCYRDVGEYQKAFRCCEKSLIVAMVAGCKEEERGAYSNSSNIYRYLGDPMKAMSYSKKHLELARSIHRNAYCALEDFKNDSTSFHGIANPVKKSQTRR